MAISERPISFGELFEVTGSPSSRIFLVVSDDEGHMQGNNCKLQKILGEALGQGDVIVVPGPYNFSAVDLSGCPRLCLIADCLTERGVEVKALDTRSPLDPQVADAWAKIDNLRATLIRIEAEMLRERGGDRLTELRDQWLKMNEEIEEQQTGMKPVECLDGFNDRDFFERVQELGRQTLHDQQKIVVLCNQDTMVNRDHNYDRLKKLAAQLDAWLAVPTSAPVDQKDVRTLLQVFGGRGNY